jgi:predicted acetyltransferase
MSMAMEIRAVTADELLAFRRTVREVFGSTETIDDPDWAVTTGTPLDRLRAAFDNGRIVATLRSFPTELTISPGATVAAGAVTAVSCRPTHRRQGLLTRLITDDLRASAERGEPVDVLISSEYPIYGRFGYGPAAPSMSWELDLRRTGFVTSREGSVEFIDNDTLRKEAPAIFERVRAARPGMISRSDDKWDQLADLRRAPEDKPWQGFRLLCRDAYGTAQGWASYTFKNDWEYGLAAAAIEVADLLAATPAAEARLWWFLSELDLVRTVKAVDRPTDDMLPWLLTDARAFRATDIGDFLWVRPLDVATLLEARTYAGSGRLVVEVTDPLGIANGRFLLDAGPDGASCTPSHEGVDLTVPVNALGALSLGGVSVATLHAAGWLDEHTAGSVARADQLLVTTIAPWCNTWF